MRLSVMIEGQEDVTWAHWRALAATTERLGFEGLYRSDHYLSVEDRRERGSLDAWGTICGLASVTSGIRLGTIVSPASFRHPSVLAKLVVTADHISGGRVELGIGAGWWESEHLRYGFPFLPARERFDVLEEQLEIITRSWAPEPFSFTGAHYAIDELDARFKPLQQPRVPIVLGGRGAPRGIALAVRYADEYNTPLTGPERCAEIRRSLDDACTAAGRDPTTLPLSLMTGFVVGRDEADLHERGRRLAQWRGQEPDAVSALLDELRPAWLVGTPDQIATRLAAYEAAGVRRVMLQHHLYEDDPALELVAGLR
ncbi:MAG: putative F420-dependent oxidoreductase [Conexibacter sp.]|nr:putative F420-dependent oxidoreductase [Conexibacter sp.]